MTESNLIVVSAFGRGLWLAVECARLGLKVQLMDVSHSLGQWIPEDVEGPFGLFQSPKIKESQWERILSEDEPLMVKNGFTIWLDDGPLEMKGPTSAHRLKQLQILEDQCKTLQSASTLWELNSENYQTIKDKPYFENWLVKLSMLYASSVDLAPTQKIKPRAAVPLFNPFLIRQSTRESAARSLLWCQKNKVEVLERVQITDIALTEKNQIKSLFFKSIDSEKTEQLESQQFAWCLTSEESQISATNLQLKMFPDGILEPEWIWVRYRLRIHASLEREQMPLHTVIIPDLSLPWVHENFLVVIRTANIELFDVWIKIPALQRFNKEYLKVRADKIVQKIVGKIGVAQPEIVSMPVSYEKTYEHSGPTRQPIYSQTAARQVGRNFKNIYYHSPEQWDLLGWEGQMRRDQIVFAEISKWWKEKLEFEERQRAKGLPK